MQNRYHIFCVLNLENAMQSNFWGVVCLRVDAEDVKAKPKNSSQDKKSVQDGHVNSASVRNVGGLTFNVDGVLSKFNEALHSRGNDINSGYGGSGSSAGSRDRPQVYGSEDLNSRSKADRIQAIMNTAATLQQKIQVETSKITGENPECKSASGNMGQLALMVIIEETRCQCLQPLCTM